MKRSAAVALAAVVILAACDEESRSPTTSSTSPQGDTQEATTQSSMDTATTQPSETNAEEPQSDLPDHVQFTGVDAGLDWVGGGHCDWNIWFIEVADDSTDWGTRVYVRDPAEVPEYEFPSQSNLNTELPDAAEEIGASEEGYELWFDPTEETIIYLVTGDHVEGWGQAVDFFGCA